MGNLPIPRSDAKMIIGRRHIELNGLFLPAKEAWLKAKHSAVALHVRTSWPDWPIEMRGSACLVRHKGRSFGVFCQHQLGQRSEKYHPRDVLFRLAGDQRLFGGASYVDLGQPDVTEQHDLCAIEMPWIYAPRISSSVFITGLDFEDPLPGERRLTFIVGYPTTLVSRKLNDHDSGCTLEELGLIQLSLKVEDIEPSPNGLWRAVIAPGETFRDRCCGDFDGFSGAPVLCLNATRQKIELLGVVIRAGGGQAYFASRKWIFEICERASSKEPINKRLIAAS